MPGVFSTAPAIRNYTQNLLTEIIGTFILVFGVLAIVGHFSTDVITDTSNQEAFAATFPPLLIGLLVFVIGLSLGGPTGYAINPARDFAPRLFTAIAGWGSDVFRAGNGWWWVPIVAPCVGGVLGGWVYDVFVGSRFE